MKKTFLFLTTTIMLLGCNEKKEATNKKSITTTLKEKIGQMIMVGFRETEIDKNTAIYQMVKEYHLGGIVLYNRDLPSKETISRNILSPKQLKKLTSDLQAIDTVPLIIGIDEEGGFVSRLNQELGFASHVSHQYIGQLDHVDSTKAWANGMAKELADLGINMNFGPDIDLNVNPDNPIIGARERSFSSSLDVVLKHAKIFIDAHTKHNILCTPKHFPGHGSSKSDTHKGLADVTATWSKQELIPFKQLMQETGIIMTSHVYNANLDTLPATISPKIIQGLLRDNFGFDGVIISDDMQMRAISNFYDFETMIEKAIKAGVDILLFSGNAAPCPPSDSDCIEIPFDPYITKKAVEHIVRLVEQDVITEERIEESYQRILKIKSKI